MPASETAIEKVLIFGSVIITRSPLNAMLKNNAQGPG